MHYFINTADMRVDVTTRTVLRLENAALVKFGYMLEYPCIPRYSFGNQTSDSVCESSSENPSDAGNQQERLIKIGWITGFVDGEGCFSINFIRQPHRHNRRGYKTGFQVAHEFAVTQGAKSLTCLQMLMEFFGVGDVYINRRYDNHKEHVHRYCVRKRSDLVYTIVPFFKQYPLRTSKQGPRTEIIRILRDYTPNTDDLFVGEDIVPSAWRHAGAM